MPPQNYRGTVDYTRMSWFAQGSRKDDPNADTDQASQDSSVILLEEILEVYRQAVACMGKKQVTRQQEHN